MLIHSYALRCGKNNVNVILWEFSINFSTFCTFGPQIHCILFFGACRKWNGHLDATKWWKRMQSWRSSKSLQRGPVLVVVCAYTCESNRKNMFEHNCNNTIPFILWIYRHVYECDYRRGFDW
jgi:hypothetical protein